MEGSYGEEGGEKSRRCEYATELEVAELYIEISLWDIMKYHDISCKFKGTPAKCQSPRQEISNEALFPREGVALRGVALNPHENINKIQWHQIEFLTFELL